MVNARLRDLLLAKATKGILVDFLSERRQVPEVATKAQLIEIAKEDDTLTDEDFDELEVMISGRPTERGFSVFLYGLKDLPHNKKDLIKRIRKAKEGLSEGSKILLVTSDTDPDPVEFDYQFQQEDLVLTDDGRYDVGVVVRRARFKVYFDDGRAEVYMGNSKLVHLVANEVGWALGISFQRLVPRVLSSLHVGTLDPITVFFMELLYNRLNKVGSIENVEKLMLDSTGVEENLHNINLKGHDIFDSPSACQMLIRGQKIMGVRFLYRLNTAYGAITTYVTLVLHEHAGLKMVIAQQNWPSVLVNQLFSIIRENYVELVQKRTYNLKALQALYKDMQSTAAKG